MKERIDMINSFGSPGAEGPEGSVTVSWSGEAPVSSTAAAKLASR